jgi:hypothetical protein
MMSISHWGMFEVGYYICEPDTHYLGVGRAVYIHPTDDRYDSKYLHG